MIEFFKTLYSEIISFFGLDAWMKMFQTGDYHLLSTFNGVISATYPLIPFLLVIELVRAAIHNRFKFQDYKIPLVMIIFNRTLGRFVSIAMVGFCIGLFEKSAIFKTTFTWYWLLYGYVVWEFSHFIYHYLGHKVRLFWCLHSTHHALDYMNLSVTYAHFFLEGPYADFIRTSICILLGVNPPLLAFIMFIDGTWGAFIHVGDNLMKNAKMGFMEKFLLTPSHHRVHHAKNYLYMDTNFCNLLNIWDRVFRTYQLEQKEEEIVYGITRPVNQNSFVDIYFGEFICLGKDIWKAPGITNKILYIFMPPGWSHEGNHKTARILKKEYFKNKREQFG
ncbi:MAG: sterol desaturase family protein [Chitinophagaceae bacterium]|jgi:sterol desaturase/sphingolipid hydroxylase (fatty acid hydroxylase superfamily)|nr:sterol desaturase family protein [Chitinophagaceae bacterium]